jgi:hypothetical protein
MTNPLYEPTTGGGLSGTNTEFASKRFSYLQEEAPELGFDAMWSLANSSIPEGDLVDEAYKAVNILQVQQGVNTLKNETKERQKALWSRFNSARKQLYTDNGYEPVSDNTNWFMKSLGKVGGALGSVASTVYDNTFNTALGNPLEAIAKGGGKLLEGLSWVQDKTMFMGNRHAIDRSAKMTNARLDTALNQARTELENKGYAFNNQQWNYFKWQYAEKHFEGYGTRTPWEVVLQGDDQGNPFEKLERDSTGVDTAAFEAFENTAQRLLKTEQYEISSWASLKRVYDGGDYQNPQVASKVQNELRESGFKGGAYDLAAYLARDKTIEDWLQEVEKVAPDSENYKTRYKEVSTYMANRNFVDAIGDLKSDSSKLSLGRSAADGLGLENNSKPWNIISGAVDAAATILLDPLIVLGKAGKAYTFTKKAVAETDLPFLRQVSKTVKAGSESGEASVAGANLVDEADALYRAGLRNEPYLAEEAAIKQFDEAATRLDDALLGGSIVETTGVINPGKKRVVDGLQSAFANVFRAKSFDDVRVAYRAKNNPFRFIDSEGKIVLDNVSDLDEVGKFLTEAEKFLVPEYAAGSKFAGEILEHVTVLKKHLQRMPTGALSKNSANAFVDSLRIKQVIKWNAWIDTVIAGFKEINLEDASQVSNAAVKLMNQLPYGRTIMGDLMDYNSKLVREGKEGLTNYDAVWDFIEHEFLHFAAGRGTGMGTRGFGNGMLITPKWRIFRTGLEDVNRLNRPGITGVDVTKTKFPNYVRLPEITAPGRYVRNFANASEDAIDAVKRLKNAKLPVRLASKPLRVAAALTWNLTHHVPRNKAIDLSDPKSVAEFERFVNEGFAVGMSKAERDGLVDLYLRGITDNGAAWAQYAGDSDDLVKAIDRMQEVRRTSEFDESPFGLFDGAVKADEIFELFDALKNGTLKDGDRINWADAFVRQIYNDVDEYLDNGGVLDEFEQVIWDEIKKVSFINPKTNSLAARVYLMRQVMEDIFTRMGIEQTEDSAKVVQRFLNGLAHMQYSPGNWDVVGLGSAAKKVALLPVAQFSTHVAFPSSRELWAQAANVSRLSKVIRRSFNSNFVEAVMGSFWKPITLLRLAFVPRAAGEEYFAFYAREGIWAPLTSMATYAGSDKRGLIGRLPARFSAWTAKKWGELGQAGLNSDAWNVTNMLAHKNVNDYITSNAEWVSNVTGRQLNKFDYFAMMSNYWTARTLKTVRGFYYNLLPEEFKRAILVRNKELGKAGFSRNMGYHELYDAHVGIENATSAFMRESYFQRVIADDTAAMGRTVAEMPYDDIPTTQTVNVRLNGFNPDSGVTLKMRAGHEWVEFNPAKMDESSLQKMAYWYSLLSLDPTLRKAFDVMAGTMSETQLLDNLAPALERTPWASQRVVVNPDEVAASREAQALYDAEIARIETLQQGAVYDEASGQWLMPLGDSGDFVPLDLRTGAYVYDPFDLNRVPSERAAMDQPDVIDKLVAKANEDRRGQQSTRDLAEAGPSLQVNRETGEFTFLYDPQIVTPTDGVTKEIAAENFAPYVEVRLNNDEEIIRLNGLIANSNLFSFQVANPDFNLEEILTELRPRTNDRGVIEHAIELAYGEQLQIINFLRSSDGVLFNFTPEYNAELLISALDQNGIQDALSSAKMLGLISPYTTLDDLPIVKKLSAMMDSIQSDDFVPELVPASTEQITEIAEAVAEEFVKRRAEKFVETTADNLFRSADSPAPRSLSNAAVNLRTAMQFGVIREDDFDSIVDTVFSLIDSRNVQNEIENLTDNIVNEITTTSDFNLPNAVFSDESMYYPQSTQQQLDELDRMDQTGEWYDFPPVEILDIFPLNKVEALELKKQIAELDPNLEPEVLRDAIHSLVLESYNKKKVTMQSNITSFFDELNLQVESGIPEEYRGQIDLVNPENIVGDDEILSYRNVMPMLQSATEPVRNDQKWLFKSMMLDDQWYVDDAGYLHIRTNRWGRNGDNSVSTTSDLDFALEWPTLEQTRRTGQETLAILDAQILKKLIRGTGAYVEEVELIARSLDGGELVVPPNAFKLFNQRTYVRSRPTATRQKVVAELRQIAAGLPREQTIFWNDRRIGGFDMGLVRDHVEAVTRRGYADIPRNEQLLIDEAHNFDIESIISKAEEFRLYIQTLPETDRDLIHRYLQSRDVAELDSPVDERISEFDFDFDTAPEHVKDALLKSPNGSAFPELFVRALQEQQNGNNTFMALVEALERMNVRTGQLLSGDQPIRVLDRAAQREVLVAAVRSSIMDPRYKTWVDGNQRLLIGSRSGQMAERMPDTASQNIYTPMVSREFAESIIDLKRNAIQVQGYNYDAFENIHTTVFKELEGFYNSLRADGMTADEEAILRSFMDQIDTDSLERSLDDRTGTRAATMVPLGTVGFTNYDDAVRVAEFLGTWRPAVAQMRPELDFRRGAPRDPSLVRTRDVRVGKMNVEKNDPNLIASNPAMPNLLTVQRDDISNKFETMSRDIQRRNSNGFLDPAGEVAQETGTYETNINEWAEVLVSALEESLYSRKGEVMHEILEPMRRGTFGVDSMGTVPATDLPEKLFAPVNYAVPENFIDQVVQFGFGKIINPAIFAIVRNPMYTLAFSRGYEAARYQNVYMRNVALDDAMEFYMTKHGLDINEVRNIWEMIPYQTRKQLSSAGDFDAELAGLIDAGKMDPDGVLASLAMNDDDLETVMAWARMDSHIERLNVQIAAERAMSDVIPYIDDHNTRSFFQEYARNIFPFEFAQEAFLKRWARTLFYSPEAFRRAQLVGHAFTNNGLIHEDAYGNRYLILPGTETLNSLLEDTPLGELMFGEDIALPTKVPLAMNTSRVLPGIPSDLENLPSFSPFAMLGLKPAMEWLPEMKPFVSVFQGGMPIDTTQGVMQMFVPRNYQRLWTSVISGYTESSLGLPGELQRHRIAAMQQMEAEAGRLRIEQYDLLEAGNEDEALKLQDQIDRLSLPDRASAAERQRWLDENAAWARSNMLIRGILGFVTPGVPQNLYEYEYLSDEFTSLLDIMDFDEAIGVFLAEHPEGGPFTIFDTGKTSKAPMTRTEESRKWLNENEDWLTKFPLAGPWLMPMPNEDSEFAPQVFYDMLGSGYRFNKEAEQWYDDFKFAAGANVYFPEKTRYDLAIEAATSEEEKRFLRAEWEAKASSIKLANPLFAELLEDRVTSEAERSIKEIDIMLALPDEDLPDAEHLDTLRMAVDSWKEYKRVYDSIGSSNTKVNREKRDTLRKEFIYFGFSFTKENPEMAGFWNSIILPALDLTSKSAALEKIGVN